MLNIMLLCGLADYQGVWSSSQFTPPCLGCCAVACGIASVPNSGGKLYSVDGGLPHIQEEPTC